MKIVLVGLVLLWTLSLAYAATENPTTDSKSNSSTQQSGQAAKGQVATSKPMHSGHSAAILSRGEADSLQIQGNGQLAMSGVSEIKVGNIGSDELIYILVVVLLVVVILAVVR